MKQLLVFLVFCCKLTIYSSNAVQHNLFYGNCVYDNNTIPIYTQVVVMDNPSAIHIQSQPVRRWYHWMSHISLRRSATTTTAPPIVLGQIINATVIFPPHNIHETRLIKCIQVIDNVQNGLGGFASIIKGGINQNTTEIHLTSQPGGKINSTVTIFSYKNPVMLSPQQTPFGWNVQTNAIPSYKSYYPWRNVHKKK